MISKRFQNDNKRLLKLNSLQMSMVDQINTKIGIKRYEFEDISCAICSSVSFESLAEKDRYGLYYPVKICNQCGLVQANPRMTNSAYEEFYENEYRSLYVGIDKPSKEFFYGQYRKGKKVYQFLKKHNILPVGERPFVFEIGCGAGGILHFFREQGYATKGIDLGSEYLGYGINEYGLDLSRGSLKNITLDTNPDLIIYSHVFEHILDLNVELSRIKGLCGPRTIVYIEAPGLKNIHSKYKMDTLLYLQNAHTYHFSLQTLCNILGKNGFALIGGNEYIRSAFKLQDSPKAAATKSDFRSAMFYLAVVERLNKYHFGKLVLLRNFVRSIIDRFE
ncbi:MAG: class I SAM-dependent methyltransferase [Myxococcota bacterium]|jgi:SAM-dependent methyltransferase|nr:class I SAM-dependent methyltransferase [Myxococcota bacterium]